MPLTPDDRESSFTLYYVKRYAGGVLGMAAVRFQGPAKLNTQFAKAVRDRMTSSQNRPKHLLAFVSPKSGKNKGVKIFRNSVLPIFEMAGIKVTQLITERQRHAEDHLQTCDLTDYDGIISVGGDGMYSEVMNGLVIRTQKDAGVDHNTPGGHMKPCDLPIGIIPAGSGDVLCMFLYGNRDPETAALHIIKGFQRSTNIYSVHHDHQLACYAGLILGFGFSGAIMHHSDKRRWMGQARYAVTIFVSMIKHAFYKLNVRYSPDDEVHNRAHIKCGDPNSQTIEEIEMSSLSGDFHSVESWVVTLVKDGEELTPLFGDSAGTVVLISKCGRLQHLKYLNELYKMKSVCYENDFIKIAKTLTYHIHFHNGPGEAPKTYLNCDGNAITAPASDFCISVLQNIVTLFGKEPETTITRL